MVIIRATCPRCSEVELSADKISLRVPVGGKNGSYAFDCPGCRQQVSKPADHRVVQLLISGGVEPEGTSHREAARQQHPGRATRNAAPVITYDDLLEFHREIQGGVLENFLRNAAV